MDKIKFPLKWLFLAHVLIITISNYAVQIPITIFGINSTLGTFTYPFIFLTTDLTVRIFGQSHARKIVFFALLPGLLLSYLIGTVFEHGQFQGIGALTIFSIFVFRISAASLAAYVIGQLSDILVFQKLRKMKTWWPAPAASSVLGNLLDTYTFFAVAFFETNDAFLAEHWIEIAFVDYLVKMSASVIIFVPIYGMVLSFISRLVARNGSLENM
ncbi:MAG: 7-cyano-7-deazaguanine/7-aminomethyl-7-deazaguanine transporter [Succinivibrio sp.]|nr:7-cyano-7-deazaguanine/7-aminomethyl-7-deazaguanine transporter [Succinivibrio sp.]